MIEKSWKRKPKIGNWFLKSTFFFKFIRFLILHFMHLIKQHHDYTCVYICPNISSDPQSYCLLNSVLPACHLGHVYPLLYEEKHHIINTSNVCIYFTVKAVTLSCCYYHFYHFFIYKTSHRLPSNLLEKPKASLPGLMKESKSSVNSPRLFSMYGLPEEEDEDEVWWKLRSDR